MRVCVCMRPITPTALKHWCVTFPRTGSRTSVHPVTTHTRTLARERAIRNYIATCYCQLARYKLLGSVSICACVNNTIVCACAIEGTQGRRYMSKSIALKKEILRNIHARKFNMNFCKTLGNIKMKLCYLIQKKI